MAQPKCDTPAVGCIIDAAHILLTSGKKISLVGLDVTHQALTTPDWMKTLNEMNHPVPSAVAAMAQGIHEYDTQTFGMTGGALHDPCVIAYLCDPYLF